MTLTKYVVAGFAVAALMLPSFGALAQETPAGGEAAPAAEAATGDQAAAETTAATPARNGGSSTASRRSRGWGITGRPRCESTSVSP